MAGYDPKKAAAYNKLRQQGLSEDQAASQAGISAAEDRFYEVNDVGSNNPKDASYNPNRGKMGPPVQGAQAVEYNKAIASGKTEQQAFAELEARRAEAKAERAAFRDEDADETFERSPVAINEKTPPGGRVVTQTVTTNTETVSGGGSTTITAGPKVSTAGSEALQPAINAKQAEIDAFNKDNPSPFARKKQGLPPLTPEENEARIAKQSELNDQATRLRNGQTELKADTPPTTTTVPNTTTTTQTVTTGTSSTNQQVDPLDDDKLSQENEAQLDATTSPANASTATAATPVVDGAGAGAGRGFVNPPVANPDTAAPEPVAEAGAGRGFVNPPVVTPEVETPAPVENPPYDDFAGVDEAVAARAAEPVDTPLTAAQQEAALEEASAGATLSAADVDAADDRNLEVQEEIRAEAETAPGGVTFPSANNDPTSALKAQVKSQGTLQSRYKQPGNGDWRVRLSLAPNSDYLYNASGAGILGPLTATNGVIFPYTPTITTTYTADYAKTDLIHSNYRGVFYKSSSVGDVQIRGTFTAQDTREAAYLLAVIHFFRSVTKMFYGQDAERGTPPPLVYLSGYGDYQFSNHSCVVTSFNYSLPNEVDYIRTNAPNNFGPNMSNRQTPRSTSPGGINFSGAIRLANALLNKGALPQTPAQNPLRSYVNNTNECTYVPTKMEIDIVLTPVQTRSQVSKQFSLEKFATGQLLRGGFW
jgi:hypothetical protein